MIKLIIILWVLVLIYFSINKIDLFKNSKRNVLVKLAAEKLSLNYASGSFLKKPKVFGQINELSVQANWRTLIEQKSISTIFEFRILFNNPLNNQFYITSKDRHISLPQEFPKGKKIKSDDAEFDSLMNIYCDDNVELLFSILNTEVKKEILTLTSESYFINVSFKGIYLCTSKIDVINSEYITSIIMKIKNLAELIDEELHRN